MKIFSIWKQRARQLKKEAHTIYRAFRDPRVPWYARLLVIFVIGYAFSPIDLIPDFIPILGYLDDLILLPLGIALVLKMIPSEVLVKYREKGEDVTGNVPASWVAAGAIIVSWLLVAIWVVTLITRGRV